MFRIDDYPTGVRPIMNDRFTKFDIVLQEFEQRDIPYLLGVVPALINEDDIEYLKSLKNLNVALHGYDHHFFCFNEYNREEFKGCSTHHIYTQLLAGLKILQDFDISTYIPPFNRYSQNLVDALIDANIETITTGVNPSVDIDHKSLNVLTPRMEFYGRSTEIINHMHLFDIDNDHIALHLTWEFDEYMKLSDKWLMPKLLDIYNDKRRS